MNKGSFHSISALKIYMKRGDNRKSSNWWGRLLEKPLSTHLVRAALQAGIMHAAVNLGHIGLRPSGFSSSLSANRRSI
jgi:hypothetical protein